MQFAVIVVLGLLLASSPVNAGQAASGVETAQLKKQKKVKPPKEEYLKAAPGTGPSGPKK
jgi:hypothetical protein